MSQVCIYGVAVHICILRLLPRWFAFSGGEMWDLEGKRNLAPKIERGFCSACADFKPRRRFYVYPCDERFPMDDRTVLLGWLSWRGR